MSAQSSAMGKCEYLPAATLAYSRGQVYNALADRGPYFCHKHASIGSQAKTSATQIQPKVMTKNAIKKRKKRMKKSQQKDQNKIEEIQKILASTMEPITYNPTMDITC